MIFHLLLSAGYSENLTRENASTEICVRKRTKAGVSRQEGKLPNGVCSETQAHRTKSAVQAIRLSTGPWPGDNLRIQRFLEK